MSQLIPFTDRPQLSTHLVATLPRRAVHITSGLKAPSASIITRARTNSTLSLTKARYRALAALCKAEAGKPLNIASETDMQGDWGMINYWALPVIDDATQPDQLYSERAYINVAHHIKTQDFRAAGKQRPECDWSKLSNSELFEFVVWHEIGHFRDNFSPIDIFFATPHDLAPEARRAASKVPYINEVLADRFAWERIRSGQPMPLTDAGRLNADQIERDIEEISRYFVRARHALKPLDPEQYCHVPAYMLTSKRKAAYVGPDVNPALIQRETEYYRDYEKKHGRIAMTSL